MDSASIERLCETLAKGTPSLSWEWDDYFGAALTAFNADVRPSVEAALDSAFEASFTAKTLAEAPERIQGLTARVRGLRGGQRIYVAGGDAPLLALGLFWPWGGGDRVSLRIKVLADPEDEAAEAALTSELKRALSL